MSAIRAGVALLAGLVAGVVSLRAGAGPVAIAVGWLAGATLFLLWTWLRVGRMGPAETRNHATAEDSTRAVTDVLLLVAAVASLGGVAFLLAGAEDHGSGHVAEALDGVASVVAAWLVVHTVFTLRYAALYYGNGAGVDFNQQTDPRYADFAYLAFTVGMTYQVSDTDLTTTDIRSAVLRQGLLSYLLGSVVLATTINLVVQLASASRG